MHYRNRLSGAELGMHRDGNNHISSTHDACHAMIHPRDEPASNNYQQ
jgi:hypothetical protein